MILGLDVSDVQIQLRSQLRAMRIKRGLTQQDLADKSGVPLPTLRKFEQKGGISLESFLKLLMVLEKLEALLKALTYDDQQEMFSSIDDVLSEHSQKDRKHRSRA